MRQYLFYYKKYSVWAEHLKEACDIIQDELNLNKINPEDVINSGESRLW